MSGNAKKNLEGCSEEGVHFKKQSGRKVEKEPGSFVAVWVRGYCRVLVVGAGIKARKWNNNTKKR